MSEDRFTTLYLPLPPPAPPGWTQQGLEDPTNISFSYLAQKRRSSVSELAAYLQDMLDEGESTRMIANTPGWTLPPPALPSTSSGNGGGGGGNSSGNRVTFKRTAPEDFEAYGEYEMDRSGGRAGGVSSNSSNGIASGELGAAGSNGARVELGKFNMKRARGGGDCGVGGGVLGRHGRRMSEARMNAKVAASPSVVQALTCLASGLPESSSDSEDNPEEAAAAAAAAAAAIGGHAGRSSGDGDDAVKREQPGIEISSGGYGGGGQSNKAAAQQDNMPMPMPMAVPNVRRGSKAIRDVVSKLSIDQAVEQLKSEEGGGGGGETDDDEEEEELQRGGPAQGEQQHKRDRQRASVYVLMHAIAAVDTANDETWGEEEPLDSLDGAHEVVEAAI